MILMISGWIGSLLDGSKVHFPRHEEVKMQTGLQQIGTNQPP